MLVTSAVNAPDASYPLRVTVADPAEPLHSGSGVADYVVLPTADGEPPSAPSGLSANVKRKHVNLVWNPASDNVAVTNYHVWRDGAPLDETSDTSYVDRSVTAGMTCRYVVVASDAAGNVSADSNEVEVSIGGGGGGNGGGGGGGGNGGGKGRPK